MLRVIFAILLFGQFSFAGDSSPTRDKYFLDQLFAIDAPSQPYSVPKSYSVSPGRRYFICPNKSPSTSPVTKSSPSDTEAESMDEGEDLSQSTSIEINKGLAEAFRDATASMGFDEKPVLIKTLVLSNSPSFWSALICYGFSNKKFSEEDFWWVIEEFSTDNRYMPNEQAERLFRILFIEASDKNKENTVTFLTNRFIKLNDRDAEEEKRARGFHHHSEVLSIMAAAVEKEYVTPVKLLLENNPKLLNEISKTLACERYERVSRAEGIQYAHVSYSLVGWLSRSEGTLTNYFLDISNEGAKTHYIDTAKHIIEFTLQKESPSVTDSLHSMIEFLFSQGDVALPEKTRANNLWHEFTSDELMFEEP